MEWVFDTLITKKVSLFYFILRLYGLVNKSDFELNFTIRNQES